MNKQHFVRTSDERTAKLLREAGLHELAKDGKYWVFVNDITKVDFSSSDLKVGFTNILNF